MTITAKTVVYNTIEPNGVISVKLGLQTMNGDILMSQAIHRFTLPPGGDVSSVCDAVDANITDMGYPALSSVDRSMISDLANLIWTADVVSAYQEKIAASK